MKVCRRQRSLGKGFRERRQQCKKCYFEIPNSNINVCFRLPLSINLLSKQRWKLRSHQINDKDIAEVISDEIVIRNEQDALDLVGNLYYQGFDNLIIHEKNITTDFFDLKNKMAGEIRQKFSNYRVKLVIVVDVQKFTSKSLNDFIYESNNGKRINFLSSIDEALAILSS